MDTRVVESLLDLFDRREKYILSSEWAIGFNDRGMGHGDFAVILKNDQFDFGELNGAQLEAMKRWHIACPSKMLAEHVVNLHNLSLLEKNDETCDDVESENSLETS